MPIRIREVNSISILDVEGKIDINSSEIIETIGWLISTGKVHILLNLENVDIVDYNGLSILAIAYKNVMNHKGKMKFLHVPLAVMELFKIVKLDSIFETYASEEDAVNSFYDEGAQAMHLRRKYTRLDIHLSVKYSLSAGQRNPKVFEGRVLNISAAGIYIYSPHTFPINTSLDLELNLPGTAKSIRASGRVIYLADKEIQPHSYPGMGVSFAHLTQDNEKAIIDFIDKNITHRAEPL